MLFVIFYNKNFKVMKTTIKAIIFAGAFLLITSNSFAQFFFRIGPVIPRGIIIGRPLPPPPARLWIEGHWGWNNRLHTYIWIPGHWMHPRHRRLHP